MLIKLPITPTIKRVREYIPVCVSAGGAAAEERWCFGVQHLHSDSSRERGAGSLGPWHLPLPLTSATGKALEPHGHDYKCKNHRFKPFFVVFFQEPHIGAEGMPGAGLPPEQLRLLQRFSPELSWEQTETTAPLPCRADSDTIGFFIAKFLKN